MKQKFKIGLILGLSIITLFFLSLTIYRWTWHYREIGKHFDENTMTAYDDDALPVFAALTVLVIIPTLIY